MAIGERIRFIRNLRGMTQKWLGQAVGFPPKTADVRMAQYESGSRTPKEDLVKAIANVLEVSPLALQVPDIDSDLGFIHTLFAIEDIHGIRAEKQGDEVHLIFDGSKRAMDESILPCFPHGQSSRRSCAAARSPKSSMTTGATHSRRKTPPSVGQKYRHRDSVICLSAHSKIIWKISEHSKSPY